MKKTFLILTLLFSILSCFGQYGDQEIVFIEYERHPQYPDGEPAMHKFIEDNLTYPQPARDAGIEGRVIIRFLVRTTGVIDSIKVIRGIDPECDKVALDIVKKMPKWEPGGIFINKERGLELELRDIWFTLPIRFDLTNWIIKNEGICKTPDRLPSFPGGEEEMYKYFREKTKPKPPCPTCTMGYLPQGRVTVRFIVTRTGKIRDVKIIKGLDQASDKIAFRAVKDMPDWTPAQHNGKDVNTYFTLPVVFRLY